MKRIKCVISYDGSDFAGFQIQPKQRTVQGELEKGLTKIHKGTFIRIHPSGRTDAGVHAIRQVFHFDTFLDLQASNWRQALNTVLPDDLLVKEANIVDSTFHARYSALEKEYRYYVLNHAEKDVFNRYYVYQFSYPLSLESMQKACEYFTGTHDFTTFSSAKATIKGSKIRTLTHAFCHMNNGKVEFIFRGDGFLYNMVRIMVGALLDIGQGRRNPEDILELLEQKDRRLLGKTAPPQGLYLWDVKYE
ncbi:tRNA pseudouridine(38-40) synthase TruA [Virgibacillus sp. MSJ-26]|uniref:tRNA pseudouridine(38-40) synthase TruA n=1 Tax=Virgibacillus sp. MSJ-26 TaxID=2841522 RepID=UPI001C122F32|nr:tRNA pseudouridine(38-40) synthase TruA [Virgibacillus sp. MSJ-26]MBU5468035.1 tRNA pseudouridine(38-40) synthase TruA [Virgibacillus sp. MSJ-26]